MGRPTTGQQSPSYCFSRPEAFYIRRKGIGIDRHPLLSLLVCCILTLAAAGAQAQRAVVIKGRVTDTSGRPVATALIGIAAFNASTTSDTHGAYRLVIRSRVRSGQHAVLTASREGYDFVSRAITLAPGAELTESFRLQPLE